MTDLEIPEGYELVNVPLHEVGFQPESAITKLYEDGREVVFYRAEPDQFVKSYVDGHAEWTPVAGFSVHRNIEVVLVELDNGGQIITDHDPRAVFGVAEGEVELRRFYPDEAVQKRVLVPVQVEEGIVKGETFYQRFIDIWGALAFKNYLRTRGQYVKIADVPGGWWDVVGADLLAGSHTPPVADSKVTWARVVDAVYTGVKATGYDLTVPGYETFMSADGIILSNTMAIHSPMLEDAIKDAKEKLLPSKMLFSVRSRDQTLPVPKHEALTGLANAQLNPSGNVHRFNSKEEAVAAIKAGQVKLQDQVEIKAPNPLAEPGPTDQTPGDV